MNRRIRFRLCALAALLIAGCTQFPVIDDRATPEMLSADFPSLVPLEPLLAAATAGRVDTVQTEAELNARVSRLKARAAGLQGSVLTGAEKQRLSQGLR